MLALAKNFWPKVPLVKTYIVVTLLFYVVLNFINVDLIIARNNIKMFNKTGRIDYYYLQQLSDDAVPELIRFADRSSPEISRQIKANLVAKKLELSGPAPWQSFNYSRYKAKQALLEDYRAKAPGKTWTQLTPLVTETSGKTVMLEFTPEPVEVLERGQPEQGWEKVKSIEVKDVAGRGKVMIHLYMKPGERPDSEVRALLEDGNILYNLGTAGSYGLNDLSVEAKDMNNDKIKELVVAGSMGAAYGEMKIIGYDPAQKGWVKLLAMGTPNNVDLDGDGKEDLVAVSGGSLPGYVWIYRWSKDHLELAGVPDNLMYFLDFRDRFFKSYILKSLNLKLGK